MIYLNEDTLVQQTTTDYLKNNLGWNVASQLHKIQKNIIGNKYGKCTKTIVR